MEPRRSHRDSRDPICSDWKRIKARGRLDESVRPALRKTAALFERITGLEFRPEVGDVSARIARNLSLLLP
ncbi:MAG: hypothetical protein ACRD2A_08410 [Vicinamibacterales bacterium]